MTVKVKYQIKDPVYGRLECDMLIEPPAKLTGLIYVVGAVTPQGVQFSREILNRIERDHQDELHQIYGALVEEAA